jgi:hypothetical protein
MKDDDAARQKSRRLIARLEGGVAMAAGVIAFLIGESVLVGGIPGRLLGVVFVLPGLAILLFPRAMGSEGHR